MRSSFLINHSSRYQFAKISLLLLVCCGCAAPLNNSASDKRAEAPDYLKAGGVWKYRVTSHSGSGGYRSNIVNGDFQVRMRKGVRSIVQFDGETTIRPTNMGALTLMLPTTAVLQNPAQYLNFPLWIGKEWKGTQRVQNRWLDSKNVVTGLEMVKTQAGSFEAYRIERYVVTFIYVRNYYRTYVYFYSPETRSIVKYDFKLEMKDLVGDQIYGLYDDQSVELLSYTPE